MRVVERDHVREVVELPEEVRVSLAAIAGVAREGLLAMGASVGLMVMHEMMTAEMTAKVGGAKHAKLAERHGNRHGDAPGSVVLGGRRVPVNRPRSFDLVDQTVGNWVRQERIDRGERDGTTSQGRERISELERQVKRLMSERDPRVR